MKNLFVRYLPVLGVKLHWVEIQWVTICMGTVSLSAGKSKQNIYSDLWYISYS